MRTKKAVALIIETSNAYARGLLCGIHDYQRQHPEWSVYLTEHGRHEPDASLAGGWRGDGVIAQVENRRTAELVAELGVPAVDVSAARLLPGVPWVETDDHAVAEAAVDHLASTGLKNLAFFGDPFYNWSTWRMTEFRTIVAESGLSDVGVFTLPERETPQVLWYTQREAIYQWVAALPKPVGIFAAYDGCGRQLLEICRHYDIPVLEDVAVVAADDDGLLCELATPPMSSVILNSRKAGFLAASILDELMTVGPADTADKPDATSRAEPEWGDPAAGELPGKVAVPPLGVRQRASTDILTVEDPHVATAVRFIRNNAHLNITVEDVLRSVPRSRRVLESRFRRAIGRTPHREILRFRVNKVRELLAETDMTLAEIAEALGFEHPEYVSVSFKKLTGLTPKAYRAQVRTGGAAW
jgi:LacI family transcriptional regulator